MAKTLVGALRVTLGLDSSEFSAGAAKASATSGKLKKSLVGIGVGAAGIATALAVTLRKSLNIADDMGKASQKFGIPVEQLSRLKYAADLSDVSLETLGTSLGQLSKKMVAAAEGGMAQSKMFADMGVKVVDANGKMRDTEAVLQDVAAVFAGMPDGAQKTALAMELFGKSGAQLIPLLNEGKTGLQAMAEEANKLGIVIDEKTAKAAEGFNDNLTRLSAAAGGLGVELASALAPTLERMSGYAVDAAMAFSELSPETKEMVTQLLAAVAVVGAAAFVFGLLSIAISPVALAVGAIAAGAFLIYDNWGPISEWFKNFWDDIKVVVEYTWEQIKTSIGGAVDWLIAKWDAFVAKLQGAIQIAKDVGKAISDALSPTATDGAGGFEGGGGGGGKSGGGPLKSSSSGSSSSGANVASGFAEGIRAGLPDVIAAVSEMSSNASAALRDYWQIKSPSQLAAGFGRNIGTGLAQGVTESNAIVGQAVKGLNDTATGAMEGIGNLGKKLGDMFAGAATNVLTGVESLSEAVGKLLQQLASMLINSAMKELFGSIFGGMFGGVSIPGFASGTPSAASGWAMVGEEGPELVRMGGGERVFNARETGRMINGGAAQGGATSVTINTYLNDELIHSSMETVGGEATISNVMRRLGK